MHLAIATVYESKLEDVLARLATVPPATDAVEIRMDALWPTVPDDETAGDTVLAITQAAKHPLIACLRPTRQGGRFQGPEEIRLGLLVALAQSGFRYVDLEVDVAATPGLVSHIESAGAKVLASHHMATLPCRDDVKTAMTALRDAAPIQKLAFGTSSFVDHIRALELAHQESRTGAPIIAPLQTPPMLRALLPLAGNQATYGHAGTPAAPGQPGLAQMQAIWTHWGLTKTDFQASDGTFLAVLGQPVDRSLSPRMHNAALRAGGKASRYGALNVPDSLGALRLVLHAAPRIGLMGASVTFPHKSHAAQLAKCDAVSSELGAANQLRFKPSGVEATNTDATALKRILAPLRQKGDTAIVLGAGGAARAALWALRENGVQAMVASRDAKRSAPAVALSQGYVPWSELASARADIWIQATTLGLEDASVLAAKPNGARVAIELNYKAGPTAFQKAAVGIGAHVVDGRAVVLEQAVDAYAFWFGEKPDQAAMRAVL